ncbi:hypothetical protein LA345_40525 (plasmid) [Burkholderia vietnamiensis]|uniref:Uncharacterized protein n=1 Tax=Burkholderia vietnamiensis (strain G4 / LMG 22486) TaxID=269482 RepID=A4JU08_BURVG|nr:hypothetical protein Bcep1808_6874 [Burkholderia vietnamiensis G4]MCB4350081.1 hypothetical protein [Burkholderia vietnamiensis]
MNPSQIQIFGLAQRFALNLRINAPVVLFKERHHGLKYQSITNRIIVGGDFHSRSQEAREVAVAQAIGLAALREDFFRFMRPFWAGSLWSVALIVAGFVAGKSFDSWAVQLTMQIVGVGMFVVAERRLKKGYPKFQVKRATYADKVAAQICGPAAVLSAIESTQAKPMSDLDAKRIEKLRDFATVA